MDRNVFIFDNTQLFPYTTQQGDNMSVCLVFSLSWLQSVLGQ